MTGTDYQKQASDLIVGMGISFSVELIGSDYPRFCADAHRGIDLNRVDTFPRKTHIHGKHYRVTFSRLNYKSLVLDFWNSYADEEFNYCLANKHTSQIFSASERMYRAHNFKDGTFGFQPPLGAKKRLPTPYDVLACVQKSDVGTFEEFCSDFGYDTDSRRAEETYRSIVGEWSKIQRFFTSAEIEQLREIN